MRTKRGMATMLVMTLVASNVGTTTLNVYADEVGKEEVIYVNTTSDGTVKDINAVNIFGRGSVTDYGDYTNVKMLNTTDKIEQNGDKITFSTNKDKVYYQGTMENVQIPWNIEITYKLDGKEIKANQIAGKSGKLVIKIKITENKESKSDFYDNYALQASVSLDTEKCENIQAEGATLANVGSNKQISYTVLPGKGLNTKITTDVNDFEMDEIAINGVKLDLNIDIDDKELMNKIKELMNASKDINNGATKVSGGTDDLQSGGDSLLEGVNSLNGGATKLDDGINTLDNGVSTMEKALNKLNKRSKSLTGGSSKILTALKTIQKQLSGVSMSTKELKQLTTSSSAIKKGIADAYEGAKTLQESLSYSTYKTTLNGKGLDIDKLKTGNQSAITSLSDQINELSKSVEQLKKLPGYENNDTYKAQVKQMEEQTISLQNIVTLLAGNNAAISGTEQYFQATEKGAKELTDGLNQLNTSYKTFDQAIVKLTASLSDVSVNVSNLKTAIDQLVKSYGTLDKGLNTYTEGVASIVTAYSKISTGTSTLVDGTKDLVGGTTTLKNGTSDLCNGISKLNTGANKLNDGTEELCDQTKGMDRKIENEIDDMLDKLSGSNAETKSFVSDKNKNVDSVQFVIKTASIQKPKIEEDTINKTEKLTFIEKLIKLFRK